MNSPRMVVSVLITGIVSMNPQPVEASFHAMQIEQVIAGVNGDTTAQAIQLRMRFNNQNHLAFGRMVAWDAAGGNPVIVVDFATSVPNGIAGNNVLIASNSFVAQTTPAAVPDFVMAALIPDSYLDSGSLTFERDDGLVFWRLSWGDYTGDTTGDLFNDLDGDFGPPFPEPLPTACARALQFQGAFSDRSLTNADDYAVTTVPAVFVNNAGDGFDVNTVDCTPFNSDCSSFACDPDGVGGNCDTESFAPPGTACEDDDADACTTGQCDGAGLCAAVPVDCTPLDTDCATFDCDRVGVEGNCDIVTFVAAGMACTDNDGDACTVGACDGAGACTPEIVDCTPLDTVCETFSCDPLGAEGNCDVSTPSLFCAFDGDSSLLVDDFGRVGALVVGGGLGNHLAEQFHYVSINGGPVMRVDADHFNILSPLTIVGDRATSVVRSIDGQLLIILRTRLIDRAGQSAMYISKATFRNLSGAPMELTQYVYCDWDIGTADGDIGLHSATGNGRLIQRDPAEVPGRKFFVRPGVPLTHWEIAPFSDTRDKLDTAAAKVDLDDATSPLSGDITEAAQFDVSLPTGGVTAMTHRFGT